MNQQGMIDLRDELELPQPTLWAPRVGGTAANALTAGQCGEFFGFGAGCVNRLRVFDENVHHLGDDCFVARLSGVTNDHELFAGHSVEPCTADGHDAVGRAAATGEATFADD